MNCLTALVVAAQSGAAVSVNLSDGPKRVRSVQCENVCNTVLGQNWCILGAEIDIRTGT